MLNVALFCFYFHRSWAWSLYSDQTMLRLAGKQGLTRKQGAQSLESRAHSAFSRASGCYIIKAATWSCVFLL
jgi:hypothetical protein